ncbi:MAG: PIG-L deacetylase family protein [Candidatus Helarchaeota archaeon]
MKMRAEEVVYIGKKLTHIVPDSILVFAPHPDDELLSCGGLILKYSELGTKVVVIGVTKGVGGYSKEAYQANIQEIRTREFEKSIELLGADRKLSFDLGYEEITATRSFIKEFTKLIRDLQPQLIFSPHPEDTHWIHRNTALCVTEAVYHSVSGRAFGGYKKEWVPYGCYFYESPSCKFEYIEGAKIICDITAYWEKKVQIFEEVYQSQKEMLERVIDWAERTAKLRGALGLCEYGEAFIPDTRYVPLKLLVT